MPSELSILQGSIAAVMEPVDVSLLVSHAEKLHITDKCITMEMINILISVHEGRHSVELLF